MTPRHAGEDRQVKYIHVRHLRCLRHPMPFLCQTIYELQVLGLLMMTGIVALEDQSMSLVCFPLTDELSIIWANTRLNYFSAETWDHQRCQKIRTCANTVKPLQLLHSCLLFCAKNDQSQIVLNFKTWMEKAVFQSCLCE